MKRLFYIFSITLIFSVLLCSCSTEMNRSDNSLSDWDLLTTGCSNDWDNNLKGNKNYKLGIIDFHTTVLSDSQKSELFHDELILKLVEKIAPNCEVHTVVLSENATPDEINTAIETLHKKGCHVINMSLGQSNPIPFSAYILDMIENETLVLVCATGNQNKGMLYPAADKNVVSVYAKDINGGIAKMDIDSETKPSFSAPGYHIYIDGDFYSGSSLATVYTSVAFSALYAHEQVTTAELIKKAMKNAINSISSNDLGII